MSYINLSPFLKRGNAIAHFRSLGNVIEFKQQLKILFKIGAISEIESLIIFTGTSVMAQELLLSSSLKALITSYIVYSMNLKDTVLLK